MRFFVGASIALFVLFAGVWHLLSKDGLLKEYAGDGLRATMTNFGSTGNKPTPGTQTREKTGLEVSQNSTRSRSAPATSRSPFAPPLSTVAPVLFRKPANLETVKYSKLSGDHSPPLPTVFPVVPNAAVALQKFANLTADHSPPSPTVFPTTPSFLSNGASDLSPPLGTVFPVKFSTLPNSHPLKFAALSGDHSPPKPTVFPGPPKAPAKPKTYANLSVDHSPPSPTVFPTTPSFLSNGASDLSPPLATVFPVKFSTLPDPAPLKFASLSADHAPPVSTVFPNTAKAPMVRRIFPRLTGNHGPPAPTVFPVVPRYYAALSVDHSPPKPTVFPVVPPTVAKPPPKRSFTRVGSPPGRYVVVARAPAAPEPPDAAETEPVVFPIRFKFAENTFTSKGRVAANDLLAYVKSRGFSSVTLSGHTDSVGDEDRNLKLSKRRLDSVAKHLRDGGYSGAITLQPRGESEPFTGVDRASYSANQLHEMDRRVELRKSN